MTMENRHITPESKAIGIYMQQVRESIPLNKNEVRKLSRLPRSTVMNVERGYSCTVDTLTILLRTYGRTWGELGSYLDKVISAKIK